MNTVGWSPAEVRVVAASAAAGQMARPWRLRLRPGYADLIPMAGADHATGDAALRAYGVSGGIAAFNVRVALSALGYGSRVTYLRLATARLPMARISAADGRADPRLGVLFDALGCGRDEPRACTQRIPGPTVRQLAEAAAGEGCTLRLIDDPVEHDLLSSLARLTEYDQQAHDVVLPVDTVRHFVPEGRHTRRPHSATRCTCEAPEMALIQTGADAPENWFQAGQALRHVLLLGRTRQVALSWGQTATRFADLRWRLPALGGIAGYPQALLRMHYPVECVSAERGPMPDEAADDGGRPLVGVS